MSPTANDVHVLTTEDELEEPEQERMMKPWSAANLPPMARNWTPDEQAKFITAANAALRDNPKDEQSAIFAGIRAAGKTKKLFKMADTIAPLDWLEKQRKGASVAFYLPQQTAQKLAQPGGLAPDDLHLTLAYLGDAGDLGEVGKLCHTLEKFAAEYPPMEAQVGGLGRFNTEDDEGYTPFHAIINAPELPDFRQGLVNTLKEAGFDVSNDFGYNPHVTLKYVSTGGRQPTRDLPKEKMAFGNLTLKMGDTRLDFPMGGGPKYYEDMTMKMYKVNGDTVTLGELAMAWVEKQVNEEKRKAQEARAKRYGIGAKPGGALTPPAGYPTNEAEYGDPVNYAYPADKERARAALGYFNHSGQREAGGYTPEEWGVIGNRLAGLVGQQLGMKYGYDNGRLMQADEAKKSIEMVILGKQAKKQLVYGVILRPNKTDGDEDIYDDDAVEEAAHDYIDKTGGAADWIHQEMLAKSEAVMVESFISPIDFIWPDSDNFKVKKGDWVGCMKVKNKEKWGKVESGEINAFSINGVGRRRPIA